MTAAPPSSAAEGAGLQAAASPLPGVPPARTRGNTAAAAAAARDPSQTTQPPSIL